MNTLVVNAGTSPGMQSVVPPWTGMYFQGVAVGVEAVAKPGYRFVGWSGKPGGNASESRGERERSGDMDGVVRGGAAAVWIHASKRIRCRSDANPGRGYLGCHVDRETHAAAKSRRARCGVRPFAGEQSVGSAVGVWLAEPPGLTSVSFEFETRRSGRGPAVKRCLHDQRE